MSPEELARYIEIMRLGRVRLATIPIAADQYLTVELAPVEPETPSGAPFVDAKGSPIDLDEGMPELARDPLERANFPPSKGD